MSTPLPRALSYVPLEQIRPAARNPQLHDRDGLILAIQDHGYLDALIVDERTGRLHAGHGRVEALVEMLARGLPCPDGLIVGDDGGWLVPVQRGWSSKDDAHAEAALIRHNDLTVRGGVDAPTLLSMLDTIQSQAPQVFEGMGYDEDEMERLFGLVNLDLGDYTGDPDTIGVPPRPGKDEDTPLDDLDDDAGKPEPDRPTIQCPGCGHRFERSL